MIFFHNLFVSSQMKIKIYWEALSNCSFRGQDFIEVDKEEWDLMDELERSETCLAYMFNLSGIEWGYEEDGDE